MRFSFLAVGLFLLAVSVLVPSVHADFVVPNGANYSWTRGSTVHSTYAQYEVFTAAAGPNAPDVGSFAGGALPAGAPSWNVYDTSGQSFVTSGGNIYSFAAPTSIHIVAPNFDLGASHTTTVLVQIRTQGNEFQVSSVNIGGAAPTETTELLRQPLGGFGGFLVDTLFRWELSGNALSYEIRFDASASSMSLDRVTVDTFTHTACRADFDQSGSLAVADIFTYLSAWFAGDPRTDFDGAGGIQVADIFAFLSAWFAGCP